MYPQCPLPRHITALYMVAVVSCVALFGRGVLLVGADVLVYSMEFHHDLESQFRDAPARFGNSLPPDGLKGMVVYADPPSACSPIKPPPAHARVLGKWVVLIQRNGCPFGEKVRNAQLANYSAAIIHNVNSSNLEPMSAKNASDILIPSVLVSSETGHMIKQNYLWEDEYYVLINDHDLPFNINTHLLLPFAIVVGICFLVMLVFMVVKCIKDRRRQRRHRLPNSSLRKIPTSKFNKGDPYETCAICLEDYQEGEKLRILPCSHAYHSKCIDPWLTRNRRVCPVCKRKVFAHDERQSDTESESETDDTAPLVRPSSYGTQGGTFVPQRENPFQRARRERRRRSESVSSLSSSGGEPSSATHHEAASSVSTSPQPSPANVRRQDLVVSSSHLVADEVEALSFNFGSSRDHSINGCPGEVPNSEEEVAQEAGDTLTAPAFKPSSPPRKPDLVI